MPIQILVLLCLTSLAVVNPNQQTMQVFEGCVGVYGLRIVAVTEGGRSATAEVLPTGIGQAPEGPLTLVGDASLDGQVTSFGPGTILVACERRVRGGKPAAMLVYHHSGIWLTGGREQQICTWGGIERQAYFGTFNGDAQRLLELAKDLAAGRYWFPPVEFSRFDAPVALGTVPGAVALLLEDIDGDGRPEVLVSDAHQSRIWSMTSGQLAALADLPGGGGLLAVPGAGGSLRIITSTGWLDRRDGAWKAAGAWPLPLSRMTIGDLDGDGLADLIAWDGARWVVQRQGAGGFADATAASGLDRLPPEPGWPIAGDLDGDGRCDLFVAAGTGHWLANVGGGRLSERPHGLRLDFSSGGDLDGATGAGAIATLWRNDTATLALPLESRYALLTGFDGKPRDVYAFGNEISEAGYGQTATLAVDLNNDGNPDLATICANRGLSLHTNRGYGSYMNMFKYNRANLPFADLDGGAVAHAAADLDGDGDLDVVAVLADGRVMWWRNRCEDNRKPVDASARQYQRILAGVRTVEVRPTGAGLIGAMVRIVAPDGRILVQTQIGANRAGTGVGPLAALLAVREPGPLDLTVTYSDGARYVAPLDLGAAGTHSRISPAHP